MAILSFMVNRMLPFMAILLSGAGLAARWDTLPSRWVIHWGANGPDGYAGRTFFGVFGLLFVAVFIALVFEAAVWLLRSTSEPKHEDLVKLYEKWIRALSLGSVMGIAIAAHLLPSGVKLGVVLLAFVVPMIVAGVLGTIYVRSQARKLNNPLPKGYGLFFYNNPNDERFIVPKTIGYGWTFNFAHRKAWWITGLLISPALIILVVALAALPALR